MQLPKQPSSLTLLRHHNNMMSPTAMWAVGPAPASGTANTFWMLPVSAGVGGSTAQSLPATTSAPTEAHQMWSFPTAQTVSGNTLQVPLHFMPMFKILGNFDFQGGRASPLQLGSMLMQQQPPYQHLGLGMSESNLGMLAALNAYSRAGLNMNSEQNHPLDHQHQHHHHSQPNDSGDDDQNSSQ